LILYLDGYDVPVNNSWIDRSDTNSSAAGNFSGTASGYYDANSLAYVFDGIDDSLLISNNITFSNMTMEITYLPISANQALDKYLGNGIEYFIGYSGSSLIYTSVNTSNILVSNANEQIGTKRHLVTTFDGTNTIFYINSVNNGSRTNNVYTKTLNGLRIGASNNQFSNIKIYSVRIYNRALSPEEIQYNYNLDKNRFGL
jgi:hypothetical protein